MRGMLRSVTLLVVTCGALLACNSDSTTDPGNNLGGGFSGAVKFNYNGAERNGDFNVSSSFSLNDWLAASKSMAYGASGSSGQEKFHSIWAHRVRSLEEKLDGFYALLNNQGVGKYSIGLTCSEADVERCAIISISFDQPINNEDEDEEDWPIYLMTSGELTVTSVTNDRLKGTFSGVATAGWGTGTNTLNITNGTFDVPVINVDQFQ